MAKSNIFKSTNRERIIKSIKLELVPTKPTIKAIREHGAMEVDRNNIERAKALHDTIDYIVKKIIKESLDSCSADFQQLYNLRCGGAEKKAAYNKQYDKIMKDITKILTSYKIKGMNITSIREAKSLKNIIPEIIKEANDIDTEKKAEWLGLLENAQGLSTILKKFIKTRIIAVSVWCPKRVMENFEIYADNMQIVKNFIETEYAEELLVSYPEFESLQYADYYEFCLTSDGIEGYNGIINGIHNEQGVIVKGYNMISNELNMKHRNEKDYTGKFFDKMKTLNQQILMPKPKAFTIEKLESDADVRVTLKEIMNKIDKKSLFDIVMLIQKAKTQEVIISGRKLHNLSNIIYGDHNVIVNKVTQFYIDNQNKELDAVKKKTDKKKIEKNIKDASIIVNNTNYTIQSIMEIMSDGGIFEKYVDLLWNKYHSISKFMAAIVSSDILTNGNLRGYVKNKKLIKGYLDALVEFRKCVNLIKKETNSENINVIFYNELEEKCSCFTNITKAMNLIRNYMTSKIRDFAEEFQVCFGVPTKYAAKWWNGDKFGAGMETIINIDGKYYYLTLGYKQKLFEFAYADEGEEYYEVFNQKTGQDASKHFPAMIFTKDVKNFFESNPDNTEYIHTDFNAPLIVKRSAYDIYRKKLFSVEGVKNGDRNKEEQKFYLQEIIDLYKKFSKVYPHYQRFTFNFKETEKYVDLGEFIADANVCMIDSSWERISKSQIDELIETGHVYAFLIKNRNMYKENMPQTTYAKIFLQMMSKENFMSGKIRLNARPAITFRKACVPYQVTHPKGSMLVDKKLADGSYIRGDLYKEIYAYYNSKKEREQLSTEAKALIKSGQVSVHIADYDIIRNKRYMEDKYFISMSYIQNAKVSERAINTISQEVINEMKNGYRTLSVIRGTTDLIYYTLYDKDRSIMKEGNLNKIGDVDFWSKLKQLNKERVLGKSDDWNYNLTVKGIKTSYLNSVIGEIIRIAVENEAIIVIEEINDTYKNKMSCIDNQDYKAFKNKLENRLIDYKPKTVKNGDVGLLTNSFQLAGTYKNSSIQNGILFSLNAAYTSSMCPQTGFVNLFDFSNIKTVSDKKIFLSLFDSIWYDEKERLFTFTFDYKNFKTKKEIEKTKWTVYAGKSRTEYDREKKCYNFINDPTKNIRTLLLNENLCKKDFSKEELPTKIVEELFIIFKNAVLLSVVKACKEVEHEYYVSPVVKEDIKVKPSKLKCYNLAKKLWYHVEQMNKSEIRTIDYTQEWLNYAMKTSLRSLEEI